MFRHLYFPTIVRLRSGSCRFPVSAWRNHRGAARSVVRRGRIFSKTAKLAAVSLRCAISSKCRITRPRWRSAPLLPERNLAHGAGMTLQFVRPDIRQSCILLAAVKSWASHSPSARIATAIASPAIAPRRFPPCSGSVISRSVPETVDMKHPAPRFAITTIPDGPDVPAIALTLRTKPTGARSAPSPLMRLFMRLCPARHSCFVPLKEPSF